MFSVKKCELFEPRCSGANVSIFAERLQCAQNAHGVNKMDFFTKPSYFLEEKNTIFITRALGSNLPFSKNQKFCSSQFLQPHRSVSMEF